MKSQWISLEYSSCKDQALITVAGVMGGKLNSAIPALTSVMMQMLGVDGKGFDPFPDLVNVPAARKV